jgi:hypothetical protein
MATEKKPKGAMDTEAMMEVYRKLAAPGEPHKLLARMEGSWKTWSRSWCETGKAPEETTGVSEQKLVLGGRFLSQEFTGEMMGSPFSGIGFTGYDNNTGKFVSTWMDTMGTGIYLFEGPVGADALSFTQKCHYNDPLRGPMEWRAVTRVVDDNTLEFEMYGTVIGGKEEKMVEMKYTRKA